MDSTTIAGISNTDGQPIWSVEEQHSSQAGGATACKVKRKRDAALQLEDVPILEKCKHKDVDTEQCDEYTEFKRAKLETLKEEKGWVDKTAADIALEEKIRVEMLEEFEKQRAQNMEEAGIMEEEPPEIRYGIRDVTSKSTGLTEQELDNEKTIDIIRQADAEMETHVMERGHTSCQRRKGYINPVSTPLSPQEWVLTRRAENISNSRVRMASQ